MIAKSTKQKRRIQNKIRAWHRGECIGALQRDEVTPDMTARWGGMVTECQTATGYARSTVFRYIMGVLRTHWGQWVTFNHYTPHMRWYEYHESQRQ